MDDKNILQSWKEISSYLGRSERTCRRWEKEFGLPVHRMDGSARASVFAYRKELDKWLDEILHADMISSRESHHPQRKKTFIILSLLAVSIFVLAILVWRNNFEKTDTLPSLPGKPSLAILYFKNKTGDESLDYWGRAFCVLLNSDLSQSRYLSVLPEDRLSHSVRQLGLLEVEDYDQQDLIRFAEKAQVDNVVLGKFVKSGGKLRISASIRNVHSGRDIVLESVDGTGGADLFSMVDTLSKRVKAQLVLPPILIDDDIDEPVDTITTRSLEAYKYYIEGRNNYYLTRRVEEAARCLEKAIDIDPEFAMAYRILSLCYWSLPGHQNEVFSCSKKAFELSQYASQRERLFIQAEYYRYQGTRNWDRAISKYQELLRIYPDDFSSNLYLGVTYSYIEDWERAVETLSKIAHIHYGRDHFAVLMTSLRARGDYAEALNVARSLPAETYPFFYLYQLAHDFMWQGNLERSLHEAEKMLERSEGWFPALRLKGDIHLLREEWTRAEETYRESTDPVAPDLGRLAFHNLALDRLASLNLSLGRFEAALAYLHQGIEDMTAIGERNRLSGFLLRKAYILFRKGDIEEAMRVCRDPYSSSNVLNKISSFHLRGLLSVEMNNLDEARRAADEIKREVEGWINPKLMRYNYHLIGHIELEKNNTEDGVAYFEKAVSLLPFQHIAQEGDEHALFYDSLAFAFYKAGDFDKAREWYENTQTLTSGRFNFGAIYAESYFMLGKLYERKGWIGKAIESYERFLDIWKDADSDIPEVEEAGRRLTALQNL